MEQNCERVEKHLYRRQYQTAGGDWETRYYACLTTWDGKRRSFRLGSDLSRARDQLGVIRKRNDAEYDFDGDKKKEMQRITFSEWTRIYLKEKVDPEKRASGVD